MSTPTETLDRPAPVGSRREPVRPSTRRGRLGERLAPLLRRDDLGGRMLFAAVPALLIVAVRIFRNRHLLPDDGLIYLRYIRNFADGHGLVYNPGVRFNGLSSPLFTYLQLVVTSVWHDYMAASALITGVGLFAASVLAAVLFSRSRPEALLAGAMLPWFGFSYLTIGMETSVFTACIALALLLYARNSPLTLIAVALVFITRGEGVFLGLLPVLQLIRNRKLPPWWVIGTSAVIALLPLAFNQLMYGSPLAATASAKRWQGQSGYWGDGILILKPSYLLVWAFDNSWLLVASLLVLLAIGVVSLRRRPVLWATLGSLGLVLTFYAIDRVPAYHWYYGPFLFFGIALASRGAAALVELARDRLPVGGPRRLPATVLGVVLAGVLLTPYARSGDTFPPGAPTYYQSIGDWLRENTAPDAVVAATEIGYIGWYSQRPIVDVLGLVNPYNAEYIGEKDRFAWLSRYRPDYIVVHDPAWQWEVFARPLVEKGLYAPDPRFHQAGYQILRLQPGVTQRRLAVFAAHRGPHPTMGVAAR